MADARMRAKAAQASGLHLVLNRKHDAYATIMKRSNNQNPWIEICPGIKRQTKASGRTMYQMLAVLEAGSKMREHRHPHEQIVHILEGRMKLIVAGEPRGASPRAALFFACTSVPVLAAKC